MASSDLKIAFSFGSGETQLLVSSSEGEITASVSSHAMSLASPVWKKFISPPWRPSQMKQSSETSSPDDNVGVRISFLPASHEPLDFREDDADALLLLLRIAHLDFISIKKQLSVSELYNLAILCDKYDCVHLIKPWVDEWSLWAARGAGQQVGGKLCFSMHCGRDKNGQLLDLDGEPIPEVMPPGIIEEITSLRQTTIESLLGIPKRRLKTYTDHKITRCRYNRPGCDALIYGSILRGLDLYNLRPEMKPEDVHLTVTALAGIISILTIFPYYSASGGVHDDCSASDFASSTSSILSNIGNPVPESHLRHMEEKSRKLRRESEL